MLMGVTKKWADDTGRFVSGEQWVRWLLRKGAKELSGITFFVRLRNLVSACRERERG